MNDVRCSRCGGKSCVCEVQGVWTAHCMVCDNQISEGVSSEAEAYDKWAELNSPEMQEAIDEKIAMGMASLVCVFAIVVVCLVGFGVVLKCVC